LIVLAMRLLIKFQYDKVKLQYNLQRSSNNGVKITVWCEIGDSQERPEILSMAPADHRRRASAGGG